MGIPCVGAGWGAAVETVLSFLPDSETRALSCRSGHRGNEDCVCVCDTCKGLQGPLWVQTLINRVCVTCKGYRDRL